MGELEIISKSSINKTERQRRMTLLKNMLYLAGAYDWQILLNVYAAVLGRIERGMDGWASDFSQLTQVVLAQESQKRKQNLSKSKHSLPPHHHGPSQSKFTSQTKEWAYFYSAYQRNACTEMADHQGQYKGKMVKLQHICVKCWLKDQTNYSHPENSPECPLFRK